jgi:uncharacterized OB-fold protein
VKEIQGFFDHLEAGEFWIPVCSSCRAVAWPPSAHCPKCLAPTILSRHEPAGILVEFSKSYVRSKEGTFGIIDAEGMRIVGKLHGEGHYIGMRMKMVSCGVDGDGTPTYDFEPDGSGH